MLACLSFAVPGSACEPPAGFVKSSPSRNRSSRRTVARHRREDHRPAARNGPASREPATTHRRDKDIAGVTGTFRLSQGPYRTVGARRLVCMTDGSFAVEEVLLTESNDAGSHFRYLVWNYTSPKFRDVAYGVGEFVRTQPSPDETLVSWTYRFALKDGVSGEEKIALPGEFPRSRVSEVDAQAAGPARRATCAASSLREPPVKKTRAVVRNFFHP